MDFKLEEKRQRVVIKNILGLVSAFLIVFAFYNYLRDYRALMIIESLIVVCNLTLLFFFDRLISIHHIKNFSIVFSNCLFLFLMYLLLANDLSNASHVWVVAMPVCTYMLTGYKTGFKLTIFYTLSICIIVTIKHYYNLEAVRTSVIINTVFLMFFLWFLAYYYEYTTTINQKELIELAHKDKLTTLYNRHAFYEFFEQKMSKRMCLLVIDLDWFKKINDTYGHDAGDYVLIQIAQNLLKNTPFGSEVFRLGGEEFAILMPNTSNNVAIETANHLIKDIEREQIVYLDTKTGQEHHIPITASIGVSCQEKKELDLLELMKHADHNLYVAKDKGRNCVVSD